MLFALFFLLLLIPLAVWLYGFHICNDFSIKNKDIKAYKNVMIIYPHADDELMTTGGLIGALKAQKTKITLAILTKGEKGTSNATLNNSLKNIRAKEAQEVAKILGISELLQEDFGDGELVSKKPELQNYLNQLFDKQCPDLIITYDLSGFYGHPDHIALSEVITNLLAEKYHNTHLWYASTPKRLLGRLTLPEHMAKDPSFKEKRMTPTIKVWVAYYILNKIKGLYAYKSQINSFRSGLPATWIPLWFYYSMPFYEYFYEVQ